MVLTLIALIPDDSAKSIVITLLIIGGQGMIRVVTDLRRTRADPDPRWRNHEALLRFLSPAVAYSICLWVAVDLWQGEADAIGWLVAVVFLLLMSAASSCWSLLKEIGQQHKIV